MEEYLYNRVKKCLMKMNMPEDTCAISFFVNANEAHEYAGYSNLPEFVINYAAEEDFENADEEEKWNCPLWVADHEEWILEYDETNECADHFLRWLLGMGILNIGEEDTENCYDADGNYIEKGPAGCYELTMLAGKIAGRLHEEGFLKEQIGREVPIIICDYEISWYVVEATKMSNEISLIEDYLEFADEMY